MFCVFVWGWGGGGGRLFLKSKYNLSSGEITGEHFQSLEYLVQKHSTSSNLVAQQI